MTKRYTLLFCLATTLFAGCNNSIPENKEKSFLKPQLKTLQLKQIADSSRKLNFAIGVILSRKETCKRIVDPNLPDKQIFRFEFTVTNWEIRFEAHNDSSELGLVFSGEGWLFANRSNQMTSFIDKGLNGLVEDTTWTPLGEPADQFPYNLENDDCKCRNHIATSFCTELSRRKSAEQALALNTFLYECIKEKYK